MPTGAGGKIQLCFDFQDGKCRQTAENCAFAHSREELAPPSVLHQHWAAAGYTQPQGLPVPGFPGWPQWPPPWMPEVNVKNKKRQKEKKTKKAKKEKKAKEEKKTKKEKKETKENQVKRDKETKNVQDDSEIETISSSDSTPQKRPKREVTDKAASGSSEISAIPLHFRRAEAFSLAESLSGKIIQRSLDLTCEVSMRRFHDAGMKHDEAYQKAFRHHCTLRGTFIHDKDLHTKEFLLDFLKLKLLDFTHAPWAQAALEEVTLPQKSDVETEGAEKPAHAIMAFEVDVASETSGVSRVAGPTSSQQRDCEDSTASNAPRNSRGALHTWLKDLDGSGGLLQYAQALEAEYDADFVQIAAARLPMERCGSALDMIDPFFWESIGVVDRQHQEMLAEGILQL